jgi:hypothetical protein
MNGYQDNIQMRPTISSQVIRSMVLSSKGIALQYKPQKQAQDNRCSLSLCAELL